MGKQINLTAYYGTTPFKTSTGKKGHGAVMAGKAKKGSRKK